jgi:hypothetical protein
MTTILKLCLCAVLAMPAASAFAALAIEINYQGLTLDFDAGSSVLELSENAGSQALGLLTQNDVTIDRADIFNAIGGPGMFEMLFNGTVINGGGTNDISFSGSEFRATDTVTTLALPSLLASFVNADISGGDVDGVTFGGGVLRIEGRVSTVSGNESILQHPLAGDWVYRGEDDGPTGIGSDGVADQFTIDDAQRDNFDSGILAILEVNINRFRDGTSTAGLDADGLFAMALIHGGFGSDSAQLQLTVVPAPGALLLGGMGMGLIGWIRRRLA